MRQRWYVGCKGTTRQPFKSAETPTQTSHGESYAAVIGPFITRRGAEYMARHGVGNPHLQTVADAEAAAKPRSKSDEAMCNVAYLDHLNREGDTAGAALLESDYPAFSAKRDAWLADRRTARKGGR